jgi:hypothetical protein
MTEAPRVFDFFNDPAGLGLFDPIILGLIAGIGVLSVLALTLMPKRIPVSAVQPVKRTGASSVSATFTPVMTAAAVPASEPAASHPGADGLARLRTIIDAGAAHSVKMSEAHAGAGLKLDAAEHALNRMIQDVRTVLDIRPVPAAPVPVEVHEVVHGNVQRTTRDPIAA